jgi:hypothetical protein
MEYLKGQAIIDKKIYTSELALVNNTARLNIEDLVFDFTDEKGCISIKIINNTSREFCIQALELLVDTLELSDYSTLVLNPEYSGENIEIKTIEGIENQSTNISFLFALFMVYRTTIAFLQVFYHPISREIISG